MCSCVTWKQINPNPIQAGLFLRERVSVTEGGGGGGLNSPRPYKSIHVSAIHTKNCCAS